MADSNVFVQNRNMEEVEKDEKKKRKSILNVVYSRYTVETVKPEVPSRRTCRIT